jgi:hypothetical protein
MFHYHFIPLLSLYKVARADAEVLTVKSSSYSKLHLTVKTFLNTELKEHSHLFTCRHIVENEGPRALFKGLGPNLVGVAPSRAIYFCAYSQAKGFFNSVLSPDTAIVHVCSASCAGQYNPSLRNRRRGSSAWFSIVLCCYPLLFKCVGFKLMRLPILAMRSCCGELVCLCYGDILVSSLCGHMRTLPWRWRLVISADFAQKMETDISGLCSEGGNCQCLRTSLCRWRLHCFRTLL